MRSSQNDLFVGVVPFVAAAQTRSFRQAALELGLSPSGVSKSITRLEAELGVRLLNRTSRVVSLTQEGESFLRSAEEAVSGVRAARQRLTDLARAPRGTLVVSLPLILGRRVVLPALPQLLARHPGLRLQVELSDRVARLAEENVDVTVRIGAREVSQLVVRKLGEVRWVTVASPAYLARHGVPDEPAALSQHNCLKFRLPHGMEQEWQFALPAGKARAGSARARLSVPTRGSLSVDDGEALIDAAVDGLGMFQAHDYAVAEALSRGELVEVLAAYRAPGPALALVFAPGKRKSPKVRAFGEFLVELFRARPRSSLAR